MKKFSQNLISAAVLTCLANAAAADDELVLHVFRDGALATDLAISLDGGAPQPVSAGGSFVFDLGAGPHSVQVLASGQPVHVFRFDAADGQNVDITVTLAANSEPAVAIDSYAKNQVAAERSGAAAGSLSGVVTLNGTPLDHATVAVRNARALATTDANGRYTLELPRGSYEIVVSHPMITGGPLRQNVRVVSGINGQQNLAFAGEGAAAVNVVPADVEQVVVVSQRERGETEQAAANIVDIIDAEALARAGGSDVAASVVRVPSITIQEDRYVFIRGLGDRYVSTTLNGATMPSTDPSKRTVPLDLFPTNMVSQLDVRKTFTANMPGESTGGNLVINTRTFPNQPGGSVSASIGYNSDLTGDKVNSDPISGDFDFLGIDDGSRQEDGLLPLISDAMNRTDLSANTIRKLQQAGGLLIKDNLDPTTTTAGPKGTLNLNYGDTMGIGDSELGYFAAANFTNGWSQRTDGISRTYGSGGDLLDDFKFEEHSNNADMSGLLSLGLSIGDHSFASNSLLSRSTESSVRVSDGFDGDELVPSYRYSMEWVERMFIAQQFSGQHSLGNLLAKWQVTASRAERESPDRREVRYDLRTGDDVDPVTGQITDGAGSGTGIYNLKTPDLLRRYDDLTDDNLDVSTDWSYEFDNSTLSAGLQGITRERESESRSYGFRGAESNAPNLSVGDVINIDTITGNPSTGYAFEDKTLASDSYEAELDLYAGYVSYDYKFSNFQIVGGGRYEQFKQTTDTFSLSGAEEAVRSEIDEGNFLPSLSFNWFVSDKSQLRATAARTVARPDFKETSNATFYDNEFDFRVRGNPLLKISEVDNYDLRFEQYWNDADNASIALFYKDLKDPIERVAVSASGTAGNTRTFQNSDAATIYGVEVDGRKEFGLNAAYTHTLFVAVNASYIESDVDLANGQSRKLQGQPDYTANLILGYDNIGTRQQYTLLLNQNGESIQDVGIQGNPDIIEEPRLSLNFNYRYEVFDDFVLKFKAINLLDSDVEFTQGGKIFQSYRRGAEFEAGFDWKF
ncbi:TonB-dependent receptor [Steroidobacter agaridevorans]|uniref:TonB-dependent receptor n=1 Tax=Steroidobacter agaridevorans TaxID=2695856 RepID=A0A829YDK2_9GAMM|nr:TonB-dependent receptor [Steroidobacter agaridevorans]GFE80716.1 TonB-dependent receptor [Steroidobacter agaridevorans]